MIEGTNPVGWTTSVAELISGGYRVVTGQSVLGGRKKTTDKMINSYKKTTKEQLERMEEK